MCVMFLLGFLKNHAKVVQKFQKKGSFDGFIFAMKEPGYVFFLFRQISSSDVYPCGRVLQL